MSEDTDQEQTEKKIAGMSLSSLMYSTLKRVRRKYVLVIGAQVQLFDY